MRGWCSSPGNAAAGHASSAPYGRAKPDMIVNPSCGPEGGPIARCRYRDKRRGREQDSCDEGGLEILLRGRLANAGNREPERRPTVGARLGPDAPALHACEALTDGQTQSCSLRSGVDDLIGAIERLEYAIDVPGRDSGSPIEDRKVGSPGTELEFAL